MHMTWTTSWSHAQRHAKTRAMHGNAIDVSVLREAGTLSPAFGEHTTLRNGTPSPFRHRNPEECIARAVVWRDRWTTTAVMASVEIYVYDLSQGKRHRVRAVSTARQGSSLPLVVLDTSWATTGLERLQCCLFTPGGRHDGRRFRKTAALLVHYAAGMTAAFSARL